MARGGGGNNYSAMDGPGEPILGGTTYGMTVPKGVRYRCFHD